MSNRLSYSQVRLYSECGKKYEYYYQDKLREKVRSGALIFGGAFDKAIEATLKDPSINELEIFDKELTNTEINKKKIYVPDSLLVVYSSSDFDADILEAEDLKFLAAKSTELLPDIPSSDPLEVYKKVLSYKKQKAYRNFREEEHKYHNLCNWFSLRRKGHLMLKAHREKILPKIKEVIGTQVKVELTNEKGDSVVGYADLVCKLEGNDAPIVMDYKTSTIDYEPDSASKSQQLTIYAHALDIKQAGYFVFKKQVVKNKVKICSKCGFNGSGARHKTCSNEIDKKRCNGEWKETISPEIDIQVIVDKIPERTTEIVLENLESVNKAIDAKVFTRNLNSCTKPFLCPYLNLCYKNSYEGLEKVDKKS